MQSITMNLIVGIVTGLLTASVLLIIKSLFFSSFLPWYRQVMYKGLKISGNWHSVSHSQKILLEINQHCEYLSGKATVLLSPEAFPEGIREQIDIDDIRTFDVKGKISERFVSLQLNHTDRARLGVISYLLQIDGDGTKLSGKGSWYAPLASSIHAGSEVFYRDESRAKIVAMAQHKRNSVNFSELEVSDDNDVVDDAELVETEEGLSNETNKQSKADA